MSILHIPQECVHVGGSSDHSTTRESSSSQLARRKGAVGANTYQIALLAPLQRRQSPTAEGLQGDNLQDVTSFVRPSLASCPSGTPSCGHMHEGVICLGQRLAEEQ
jgi:hypothetical protein